MPRQPAVYDSVHYGSPGRRDPCVGAVVVAVSAETSGAVTLGLLDNSGRTIPVDPDEWHWPERTA